MGGLKGRNVERSTSEYLAHAFQQELVATTSQCSQDAGEGGKSICCPGVLRSVGYLPGNHRRAQRPLSPVISRVDAWLLQETQQVAPVIVPAQFVLQSPVLRVCQGILQPKDGDDMPPLVSIAGPGRQSPAPLLDDMTAKAPSLLAAAVSGGCRNCALSLSWSLPRR